MSHHPLHLQNLCLSHGIDIHNQDWDNAITQYRLANPELDNGDPVLMEQFSAFLASRTQTSKMPYQQPQDQASSSRNTATEISAQDIFKIFHEVGQQLRLNIGSQPPRSDTSSRYRGVKIADPPRFTGTDRKKLKPWLAHIRLKISTERSRFETEESKVAYALSFLSDIAFTHYQQDILHRFHQVPRPYHLQSLDNLLEHLEENFGDRGAENAALREITELRQGTSAAYSYFTKFSQISSYLAWEGTAFRDHFYRGLRDEIKDELSKTTLPGSLEELAGRAIEIDNRLYERRMERKVQSGIPASNNPRSLRSNGHGSGTHRTRSNSSPPSLRSPIGTPSTAMEIDATAPKKRLSPQEKQRRKQEGLCLYCGKAGHFAPNCPSKTIGSQPGTKKGLASVTYSISGPNPAPAIASTTEDSTSGNA